MKTEIIINGQKMSLKLGHSVDEWKRKFGTNWDLWTFKLEEFLDGSVEVDENMVYWYIDGFVFETEE